MSAVLLSAPNRVFTLWNVGWALMMVLGVTAGLHALEFALFPAEPLGTQRTRMFVFALVGYAHTVGGALASIIGPFQFLHVLRRKYRDLHVWLGRIYLVSVVGSAVASLVLSPNSMAKNNGGIAFICLALAWLYTAVQAYVTIRNRNVVAHRQWMMRCYALTFAAPSLRIQMPLLIGAGMSPGLALDIVGWTCWVPSLLLVEYWIRREQARTKDSPTAAILRS
jgi:uncharacterized membrane protein